MKLKGTCTRCGREFLAEEVVQRHGHCPNCGRAFNGDYTAHLAQALQRVEGAANALHDALEDLASMELTMDIDEGSIVQPVAEAVRKTGGKRSRI